MKKGRKIMQRLLTTLLCLALCTADIIPTGMTVLAREQEAQTGQEETDTAGKKEQMSEEEIEAEEPAENELSVKEGDGEIALPVEEEQESVPENTVEEDLDSVSENTVEEATDAYSVMTASEEIIASGTSNNISWVIDANGKLTVSGTGDFSRNLSFPFTVAPWNTHALSIKEAEVVVSGMTNASDMFSGCSNLTTLDLSNFDTSSVTNMADMFRNCENLTTLDLSSFDTSSVTNMADMFSGCRNLTSLNLSNFNTGNVTSMSEMFIVCENLSTLNLSNFDTSNVTNMEKMFFGCSNLTTLDISSFNTGNVKKMSEMFHYCESLTTLDISNFDTSNVTDMSGMFSDCSNLTTLDLSSFDTSNVTDMSNMFASCSNLTTLNVSHFDTSSVTNMTCMFSNCSSLTELDVSNFNISNVIYMSDMFRNCENLSTIYTPCNVTQSVELPVNPGSIWSRSDDSTFVDELPKNLNYSVTLKKDAPMDAIAIGISNSILWKIDKSGKLTVTGTGDFKRLYDTDVPWHDYSGLIKSAEVSVTGMTDASYMFSYCDLTTFDFSNFDTSSVTNMTHMFSYCPNLIEPDFSNFNTENVTDMSEMFIDCLNLTTLDLSSFNTQNVTNMSEMFSGCSNLTSLDLSSFNTENVTAMPLMFSYCLNLSTLDLSSFNTDSVTSMFYMFLECTNLTTIDLSSFNTDNVTDMSNMFYNCSNLTSLDLSNFDTSHVTNMDRMFMGCDSLTTIYTPCNITQSVELPANSGDKWYLSDDGTMITELPKNLNYSVTLIKKDASMIDIASGKSNDISWVIDKNGKLTVSGTGDFERTAFDPNDPYSFNCAPWCTYAESIKTAEINVRSMIFAYNMFKGCSNLTELDLSNFDTSDVTDMEDMFYGCNNLTTLDLSNFNTDNVTDMSGMFYGCKSLTSLDVSNFNTSSVTDMSGMFKNCSNLTSLNVSDFDTGSVTDMSGMFENCSNLITLDINSFNTDNVTNMNSMFDRCFRLTTLDVSNFNTSSVTDMSGMFYGCKSLTSLDLSSFNTGNVTNMGCMFIDCNSLTNLDYSSFNTASVTQMCGMFSGCKSLTSLDLSSFNTASVTDMSGMFSFCNSLTSLDLSSFNTGNVTDMNSMFAMCENLTSLDLSSFNTANVTQMFFMFVECESLTSLDLSSFNTCNVTDMGNMFEDCKSLTELNLSSFNTGNVTNMGYMFYGCNSLTTLDLSNFDTSSVTGMNSMFEDCKSLTELNLSSFNTGNVKYMNSMFKGCKNLTTLDLSSFDTCNATEICNGMYAMEMFFVDCDNLTTIYTPRNVKQNVDLPAEPGDKWYRSDGTVVTQLPQYLDDSVALGKNHVPNDRKPDISPDDPDDPNDGVLPEDIPEDGVIPKGLWISKIAAQTYTGAAIKPEVRVYNGEKRLKQGTDYTLSYQNNIKAAQASDDKAPMVVVKGKGNYSGTETKPFTIAKRDISDTSVTKDFTDAYTPLTNGKNPTLVFSAKYNNKALKKNTDYTLTVKDANRNEVTSYGAIGNYTAVVKGAGNYTGECSFTFKVLDKVPVSKLKIGKIATVNYDGTSKTPEPVIKYGKVTLNKGTDYTLSYLSNTAIGTATIVITGMGDYFGTRNETFSIAGLPIKQAKFTGFVKSFPYTGGEVYQTTAVLKYGENDLVQGTDYTVSYSNCLNKGKATVTYIGIGKYTGTIKKTYSITTYNITTDTQKRIKLSTDAISAGYAKGGARPSLKVYDGTRLLTEGKDYTLSYQNNTAVTTSATMKQPTIMVKGKGNYAGVFSEKKTFTIATKDIAEVTVTAPDVAASPKVGKYKSTPVLTDTDGKKLKAGTDYDKTYTYTYKTTTEKVLNNGTEVTRNAGDPVEEKDIVPANAVLCVRIKAKEGSNYTGEKTAEYRIVTSLINKAKITVQNPAQNNKNQFPYTGQEIRLDKSNLIVKIGRDVLSDDQYKILEDTYKNNVGKGTASVQISGVGNYGGTTTVKFKIGTKGFRWF